jgi:hypothetical protein
MCLALLQCAKGGSFFRLNNFAHSALTMGGQHFDGRQLGSKHRDDG